MFSLLRVPCSRPSQGFHLEGSRGPYVIGVVIFLLRLVHSSGLEVTGHKDNSEMVYPW